MNHKKEGKAIRCIILTAGACIYALLYALGSQIDSIGTCSAKTTALRFACALPIALGVCTALLRWGIPRMRTWAAGGKNTKPFCSWRAFALIFLCYVPMLLIEYPGSFMYDTQRQTFQIAADAYDVFHPLAHTLLIRLCLSAYGMLQSIERCALLYSLIQMVLVSACFAQVCQSISRTVSRRAACVSLAFFCLHPAHMAFAANCTKDALFAAFFALFLALCLECICTADFSAGRYALLMASGALACLFRNNMVYALFVFTVLLCIRWRQYGKLALSGLLAMVLAFGVNAGLRFATDAGDGALVEMLSVPIQQVSRARLMADEAFTEEERTLMDTVFSDSLFLRYEPTLADPVKNQLDDALVRAKLPELAKLWLDVGVKCPGVYLDAFLNLALPSLYPYSRYTVAQPYIEVGLQNGVLTAPFDQKPMTQPARFEGIRTFLAQRLYDTGADDVPLVRWLFNTGGIFWLLLLLWLYALYAGEYKRAMVLLLAVLLWGTYLLGPVMQGRYLYPFLCSLPLFAFGGCGKAQSAHREGDER